MSTGLLRPFDDDLIDEVATEVGLTPPALRELVDRHQAAVRDTPGVDDLVYEWRRFYPYDPVIARTDTAYIVAPDETVWDEFATALDLPPTEREALMTVHARQARRRAAPDRLDGTAPMVLTR